MTTAGNPEHFIEVSSQLLRETKNSRDAVLADDLQGFLERYLSLEQNLPRSDYELLQAQMLLRRVLMETRSYELVYKWYPSFKYPYGEDLRESVKSHEKQLRASVDGHRWITDYESVLECGCGAESLGFVLAKYNGQWIASDISRPEAFDGLCEVFSPGKTFEFRKLNAVTLDGVDTESVEAVISRSFFEHLLIDDALTHIAQAYRVLKRGGDLIIECPAGVGPPSDITNRFPEYKTPQGLHIKEWGVAELTDELRSIGYSPVHSRFVRVRGTQRLPIKIQRGNIVPVRLAAFMESLAKRTWDPLARSFLGRKLWKQVWGHLGATSIYLIARKPKHS